MKMFYGAIFDSLFFIFFTYPRNHLETATSPGPVRFCHNDLQQGMICDRHK